MNKNYIEKLLEGVDSSAGSLQGVEWKALGDVTEIKTGQSISKDIISTNPGEYPVINSGREPLGYVNKWNTENDPIGITTRGAGVGSIIWQEGKYFRGNLNYSVSINNNKKLMTRYLYHLLLKMQTEIQSLCTYQGIPALNAGNLKKLQIPIPPLSVQKEIVRMLNTFTELIAELTTELTARKQQYSFYREELLSFEEGEVEHLPMGHESIGKFIRGGGLQKKDFTETGVGCIHYGQLYTHYGTYTKKTKTFVSEEFAKKARMAKKGDLVIATTSENDEDLCKAVAWLGDERIAVSSDACFYTHTLNPKYVAYFFQTEQFHQQKRPFITGTKVRRVNADNLAKIKIPVPSPKEQARIVSILDKFDTLTNSISEGLPKEIELRQKQYEYYRDRLLTFPSLSE